MALDTHVQGLGKLLGNFHSLEFTLRLYLYKLPSAPSSGVLYGTDIYSFPVGTELNECAITNYDSLGDLIDKYNKEMKARGVAALDQEIVEIRNALAHGRVSAKNMDKPLRLLKFSKPNKSGRVCITFNEELSEVWFTTQIERVANAIQSVRQQLAP